MDERFAKDVKAGLSAVPKHLNSKYFYDEKGDALFQAIMQLEEYYLTRSEYEILDMEKDTLLSLFSSGDRQFDLIEFGSGDGKKTKLLLKHFIRKKIPFTYFPIDISGHVLDLLKNELHQTMPGLHVKPLKEEYFNALASLPGNNSARKVVLFLGSNIGNFKNEDSSRFLKKLAAHLSPGDFVMIGFDLQKNPSVILNAYNDKHGVTKAFNLNILNRINKMLDADFDLIEFDHYPTYDPHTGEMKSFLISKKKQLVNFKAINWVAEFEKWENIHTETSRKFNLAMIEVLAEVNGFEICENVFDCRHYFMDSVWKVKG